MIMRSQETIDYALPELRKLHQLKAQTSKQAEAPINKKVYHKRFDSYMRQTRHPGMPSPRLAKSPTKASQMQLV